MAVHPTNCVKNLKDVSETTPPTLEAISRHDLQVWTEASSGRAAESHGFQSDSILRAWALTKGKNGPFCAHNAQFPCNGGYGQASSSSMWNTI